MMIPAVRWSPGSGKAVKRGSSDKATFIRKVADSLAQCAIRRAGSAVDRAFGQQPGEQQLGMDAGDHRLGAIRLAAGDGAGRLAALDDHLVDRRVEDDLDARLARRLGHRLGDRAHAADRMAPGALDPGRLAEDVVEQDIGRARRIGAGIMADDRVEAEQGLDEIVAEIALEDVGRRLGEEIDADGAAPRGRAARRRRRASARRTGRRGRRRHWAARAAAIGEARRRPRSAPRNRRRNSRRRPGEWRAISRLVSPPRPASR